VTGCFWARPDFEFIRPERIGLGFNGPADVLKLEFVCLTDWLNMFCMMIIIY